MTNKTPKVITVQLQYGKADIVKGQSIRLYGVRYAGSQYGTSYDTTFKIGDQAEYDSYNLHYTGVITGITDKTVTITEDYGSPAPKHRLKLEQFEWRNFDFDAVRIAAANCDTMMHI